MNFHPLKIAAAAAASLALAGCASTMDGRGYYPSSGYGSSYYGQDYYGYNNTAVQTYYGRVEDVRTVAIAADSGVGMGAVLGALVGGAIGNQLGDGSGRTVATIGGAIAGGYIGDRIQDNRTGTRTGVQVVVRLDNGQRVTVIQDARYRLYEGQRVRVTGRGDEFQVIPY